MQVSEGMTEKIRALLAETPQRNPYKRFTILTYQLADVGKCVRYMEIYPRDRKEYAAHLKTALSDLLVQTLILIELYGFQAAEISELGAERLDEFKRKGTYQESE